MEFKNVTSQVADLDTASRRVKVVISSMGNLDHDGDIIHEKAYDKTISERGPQGKNMIYFLRDHNASVSTGLIGKFSELYTQNNQLIGVSILPDTVVGNDMMKMYSAGLINQHSVGFKTVESENVKGENKGSGYRLIKQIMMYEGSAVLFGANELTPTLSVGKSVSKQESADNICQQMDLLQKEIKSGSYSDGMFPLMELKFQQLNDQVKDLGVITTRAAEAPGPDSLEFLIGRFTKLNGLFGDKDTQAAKAAIEKKEAELKAYLIRRQGTAGRLKANFVRP
jgi:uncharacterized protein